MDTLLRRYRAEDTGLKTVIPSLREIHSDTKTAEQLPDTAPPGAATVLRASRSPPVPGHTQRTRGTRSDPEEIDKRLMEGEKEEKEEEEEEEEKELHPHVVAAASSVDYQDLPIMHWEDLSQRIAELEKQEQERRERAKVSHEEEQRRLKLLVVFTRQGFHNHRNLQLCFINKSDSEDEEGSDTKVSMGTGPNGCHAAGLKQEVATALRTLRDKLLAEQKEKETDREVCVSVVFLPALSSELVTHLLVRDQLRTKQDAMLLDVQDLT
ncbi:hypothetical protein F2P81_024858 [Scophthalmus maximus]|uniref:Schwannomin interacting protein 1 C-terminal domain-containing protein n=1 Tax=Scophthalmus maximus TaxID=52904 RepID=A0A6A4RRF1_SCOMX|nr:hypothetical protein F2P81_024858 [Scophthalmus maximus]